MFRGPFNGPKGRFLIFDSLDGKQYAIALMALNLFTGKQEKQVRYRSGLYPSLLLIKTTE